MEAQVHGVKVPKAGGESAGRGLLARVRAAVSDSAWGSLAGKGLVYGAGFALLAVVGSGRIHCLAAQAHEKSAEAGALSAAASAPPREAARARHLLHEAVAEVTKGQENMTGLSMHAAPLEPNYRGWMEYRGRILDELVRLRDLAAAH